jgi:hypothetical protein
VANVTGGTLIGWISGGTIQAVVAATQHNHAVSALPFCCPTIFFWRAFERQWHPGQQGGVGGRGHLRALVLLAAGPDNHRD